jgi:hypothetical protein
MPLDNTDKTKWFNKSILPLLEGYEINHRFYESGDFGSLHQIEFNSTSKGGNIDFWGLDWLGIFLYDYAKEKELLNILIEPNDQIQKEDGFKKLIDLIK